MSEKWYVIKVSEENREKYSIPEDYVAIKYRDGLENTITEYGDTTILITPSKDVAETIVRELNEQLREQSN
ncbi:hypothetical protein HYP40_gp44 [Lactococcus phage 96401]|uniref:Uncharacterized protein n=1 Tax=Lactococcus phage 96401 TaxID=2029674 RepID=A0A343JQW2_9CAUD|nr:hypothetical protein HYP40_gp40 [Lactococcus phage 96401]YP_009878715.1 hypothetical protein HYP40_gp44 [Lactococcus phage 96401]ASZ71885.1 hypothetical protein 96401_40 [Lactococcus phage 96401]ASZ71889.1 hypothetical protein 96401_44 [Lactococcus phage 96401]